MDLTIIDTRGGACSDTEELALAADIVLVPAMVSHLFFSLTLETVDWLDAMTATVADGEPAPLYRTVLMNIPSGIAAVAFASSEDDRIRALGGIRPTERELVRDALGLPNLPTPVKNSQVFKEMPGFGPLSLTAATYGKANRAMKAGHHQTALNVCESLLEDVLDTVDRANAS